MFSLEIGKKTYTLYGINERLISERGRISPKVSAIVPTPFPCFWESVGDKMRNHDAGSSLSVWSLHLKSEASPMLRKGVGWSGR